MTMILDGKKLRDITADRLKQEIAELGKKPTLVILQVGDLAESNAYIKQKKLFAEKIGAIVEHKAFPVTVTEDTLIDGIKKLNTDKNVHGIILQLPIPQDLNKDLIIDTIHPIKDVDGLTATNVKLLWNKDEKAVVPATARGVINLLQHYDVTLDGKRVVVIGRSSLVGKPLAMTLLKENATVTICHRHTKNLEEETKRADIIISAAGSAELIGKEHVGKNQIIVDVGINVGNSQKPENEVPKAKMVGDTKFDEIKDIVAAISPVPGGVGPMTVASLFQNLLDAVKRLV